jgi:hypothetical protein
VPFFHHAFDADRFTRSTATLPSRATASSSAFSTGSGSSPPSRRIW